MSATRTDWPYDADRDDPLTALRIPAVTSFNPSWHYVAAYLKPVTEGPDYLKGPPFGSNERPTDAEARMMSSFLLEHRHYWFRNEGYAREMDKRPVDIDSGWNTIVFIKYGPDDWGYRRCSWVYGPAFVPPSPSHRERYPDEACGGPLSLEQVMDRIHSLGDDKPTRDWTEWKAAHPDVFGAGA